DAWRRGLEKHGLAGELHSVETAHSIEGAYRLVGRLLGRKGRKVPAVPALGSALLCVTGPAAVGAMRACSEAGVAIGRDLSLVAMNDEGLGPYLVPSLTSLQSPAREPFLRPAADWMIGRGPWRGPLLVEPADIPMFFGESSGPAPASRGK
ncbi:MAG TPA: substrate-binding domain-containing protein, partial [Candidatus Methylacidiphilales bacterium]